MCWVPPLIYARFTESFIILVALGIFQVIWHYMEGVQFNWKKQLCNKIHFFPVKLSYSGQICTFFSNKRYNVFISQGPREEQITHCQKTKSLELTMFIMHNFFVSYHTIYIIHILIFCIWLTRQSTILLVFVSQCLCRCLSVCLCLTLKGLFTKKSNFHSRIYGSYVKFRPI